MARRIFTAAPSTPVEYLVQRVQNDYLHLPDPGPLYVVLGAAAANMMYGNPVWLMLVGAPSAGGTVLLETLGRIPHIVEAGMIESPAAFLSGTSEQERSKQATGGLLREIGDAGGIVIKDFTSILSLSRENQRRILAVFREIYDGKWVRPIGSDGGRNMKWEGKCAMFAKVTGVIDQAHDASSALGERWVYYRLGEVDTFERSRRALLYSYHPEWKDELRYLVAAFFESQDLSFESPIHHRDLTGPELTRIICMGDLASRCRSAVLRSQTYSQEIVGVRETEAGPRISTVLAQLFMGMEYIGVPADMAWRLLGKVALDSMPKLRRVILDGARDPSGVSLSHLVANTGTSKAAIRRAAEDLEVHGVVHLNKFGQDYLITTTDYVRGELRKGWRGNIESL